MSLARLRRLPIPRGAALYVLLMGIALFGRLSGLFNVYQHLGLHPPSVWRGEVWRLITYPLLPLGPIDLILGAWAILWISSWLEREWTARELWLYAGVCSIFAGLVACLLFPRFDGLLGGAAITIFSLLVLWIRLCGHHRVLAAPGMETTIRTYALVWGGVMVLVTWFSCGRWFALPMIATSAASGWICLSLRWRWLERAAHRPVESRRTRNLEL